MKLANLTLTSTPNTTQPDAAGITSHLNQVTYIANRELAIADRVETALADWVATLSGHQWQQATLGENLLGKLIAGTGTSGKKHYVLFRGRLIALEVVPQNVLQTLMGRPVQYDMTLATAKGNTKVRIGRVGRLFTPLLEGAADRSTLREMAREYRKIMNTLGLVLSTQRLDATQADEFMRIALMVQLHMARILFTQPAGNPLTQFMHESHTDTSALVKLAQLYIACEPATSPSVATAQSILALTSATASDPFTNVDDQVLVAPLAGLLYGQLPRDMTANVPELTVSNFSILTQTNLTVLPLDQLMPWSQLSLKYR